MKKTLIAIAAIAAMGSASAQVTIYGNLDVAVAHKTTEGTDDAGWGVAGSASGGNYSTNTFGVKASSDVGSGLKVTGQLEAGFNPNSEKSFTGGSWSRVGKIGLEGSFGAIQLGTDWAPYDNAMNDALDYVHFSAQYAAWSRTTSLHGDNGTSAVSGANNGNMENAIQYTTPTVSGFNAVVAYAPSKDKYGTIGKKDSSYTGVGLNYAAGPLFVSFATEHVPTAVQMAGAGESYTNAWVLTGTYDLGAVKLFAGFEQAQGDATSTFNLTAVTLHGKDSGYSFGVKVPMGQLTLSAGYGYEKSTADISASGLSASIENHAASFGLQALYALNKTATVYAGYNQITDTSWSGYTGLTAVDTKSTTTSAGLRLQF